LLKEKELKEFHIESGKILSPAAKDYLNQMRVRVIFEPRTADTKKNGAHPGSVKGFVDAVTGEEYTEKPECMTHLFGNRLVYKDHARIAFRGAIDHLQSQIVFAQVSLRSGYPDKLINDLEDVLNFARNLLRAEVLDEQLGDMQLLGLSISELRDQSHNPEKYFGVKAMTKPHYSMGEGFAHLNLLRSMTRQAEVAAVQALMDDREESCHEIVIALNRMSSGFHILCCRLLSGYYGNGGRDV